MELLVPEPGAGGCRADPRDRRRGIRRGARAAAGRRGRARGLRRPRHPLVPAGAPRGAIPRRAAAARRPPGHPRATSTATRRGRTAAAPSRRWPGLRSSAATQYLAICDHTVAVSVVPGLDADAVRRQGEEIAAANERLAPFRDPARDRVRHPRRRDARPPGRRARRAGLGDGERPRRPAREPRRADEAHGRGDVPPVRFGHQPPDRKADRPARAERARPRHGLPGGARDGHRSSRRTASPTGST